ncbi:MAG: hypothetical protein IPP61_07265 [Cytophagaceae bacterium]|nr:hypothetical protein [Cytophagaceae bacterium]MBK9935704.1 hypothetical protein [Cytophagaceae bacterium]MBL0302145.1 hypothetical protein [Cytophagaceae bacterium]MBL0324965.1 hypothetical protein [Cytophagaceae bacterium]
MNNQADSPNDLFYGLGIEFYEESFTMPIVKAAAFEIQDFFRLKNIKPNEKLKRKTLAWMYFRQHHMLSLVKRPKLFERLMLWMIFKINGFKI